MTNPTKAQQKVLKELVKVGGSFGSAGFLSSNLGLKIKTVKNHLNKLESMGLVTKSICSFHGCDIFEAVE